PSAEQMSREAVAQGVWRGGGRKAESEASTRHRLLNHALSKRPTFGAAEERLARRERPGAARLVLGNRGANDRQERHDALLAALSGDSSRLAQRQVGTLQRQRFSDAQPGTVHQQQHGSVARTDPFLGGGMFDRRSEILRLVWRNRTRQPLFDTRPAQSR